MKPFDEFIELCKAHGLPLPEKEFRFHPIRRWRIDYCFVEQKLAVEIEGGIYGVGKPCPVCKRPSVGAHTSIKMLKKDMEKYNQLAIQGYWLLRFTPQEVKNGYAIDVIKEWFKNKWMTA